MKNTALILLLLIALSCLKAQNNATLTSLDITKIKTVGTVIINNEGTHIAYILSTPADPKIENKRASSTLYVYDIANKTHIPFVGKKGLGNVSFRPGKNTLSFTSQGEDDKIKSLYEISLAGGEATRIFAFKTSILRYDWSADGTKLAFVAKEYDQSKKAVLPYKPVIFEEDHNYSRAFVVDLNDNKPAKIPLEGHVHSIKWSPDGTKLALSISPTPLIDDYYMKQKIHIINSQDFSLVNKIDTKGKVGHYFWSPDSRQVAILAAADVHDNTSGRILMADLNNGEPENLLPDFEGKFEEITWLDKNTLLFSASQRTNVLLGKLDIKSKKIEKVIDGSPVAFTSFSRAKNGNLAMNGSTGTYPNELHWVKAGTTEIKRVTNSNSWLDNKKLGKQDVITYESRDGLELQGILIHPVNEQKNKKYPIIVAVHGGPEAHYLDRWVTSYSSPGQVAAGKDYFVFYPNYRGSTGRGMAFGKSSQADPAGKEFDDIVDGVDHLVSLGLVDKSKVGITGVSYGGYATAWASTYYTERFAAGVMLAGITNKTTNYLTSEITNELQLIHNIKHVYDDYDFFLKRSPVYYAGQAKTPLLIMAGKEDLRVDPRQSLELYRQIKLRTNTPVRLVFYPGEFHGNRKATARYDYNIRMMQWFDNYLKGENEDMPDSDISGLIK